MDSSDSVAETFDVTPVRSRPVLAPRVPAVTALAAARRSMSGGKKLKWRTRDSQASQLYNLELDVKDLKQEIQRLMDLQHILDSRTFNRRDALDGSYVKSVMEYHRVFKNGYHPGVAADATQFVVQLMDEDVAIGRFAGREVVLHQWEQYTKALVGFEFHYQSSCVVSAEGQTHVTSFANYKHVVTRDTLEIMFPQAIRNYPLIAAKMIGRVFNGMGQFKFTFDTETHRVVALDAQLDFLQVFSHLLRDPRDLCAIFEGARISEECLIGDVTCYEERQPQQPILGRSQVEPGFASETEEKGLGRLDDDIEEHRQPSLAARGKRASGHFRN